FPRSGGTWLGQLLSAYLDIPFPRNTFPKYCRSIVHGHFLPAGSSGNINKIFFLVRDGRDVMVSFYYHSLVWNEKNSLSPKSVTYFRNNLNFTDYSDIRTNLPEFIRFVFTNRPSRMNQFFHEGDWGSFNKSWINYNDHNGENLILIRYEDLLKNTNKELKRILDLTGIEKINEEKIKSVVEEFSFRNQSERIPGVENSDSFLRKGISGDWKNKFTKEAGEVFSIFAGDMLEKLGYEKNSSWVNNL
ncbi:MAG: sulfotransferase domain-containing protein, partial [Candidatus Aminicenantes bacterium]|nr:sulfotransferase domain-containing protein [Candidatus Aminicenantes bacterium]